MHQIVVCQSPINNKKEDENSTSVLENRRGVLFSRRPVKAASGTHRLCCSHRAVSVQAEGKVGSVVECDSNMGKFFWFSLLLAVLSLLIGGRIDNFR